MASPAMWVWIGRVLSSLIFLLGFRMCDKIEGKSAIAMVATTGETTEGADGTKKSKRAIIRSFFARPKKETLQPADPEDAQKAVALAEAEEDNQMETSSKSAAADEPFRLKMWQAAAGGLLAVVLVNSTLNSVVYSYLDTYSDALGLVERGGTEVAEKLMQAKEQLHYDMVMGHIPTMTQTELSEKLQEIGHELEEEHKVSMPSHFTATLTTWYPPPVAISKWGGGGRHQQNFPFSLLAPMVISGPNPSPCGWQLKTWFGDLFSGL